MNGAATKMEGMLSRIQIVYDDLDDLIMFQDEWVGVTAIYHGICGILARGKRGVECWYFWRYVGYFVEEGARYISR